MSNSLLTKYLRKHASLRTLKPELPEYSYSGAVVIPCLAESENLPLTLASLSKCSPDSLRETMVLVVVNQAPECGPEKSADNQRLLSLLRESELHISEDMNLFWIDAASPGYEIFKGGVGAARKIGMDSALQYLCREDSLLFCLDADTLVEPNYLDAAYIFFKDNSASAAVCDFRHQNSENAAEQAAIIEYELYMRYYELGLKLAGSPYAYQALGSAIVTTAASYIKAGGMRVKNGGEDFYFLQALRKFGPVMTLDTTTVHPAARQSDRVAFGTGPRIRRIADGEHMIFHHPGIFYELRNVVTLVRANLDNPEKIPEYLESGASAGFFYENHFADSWTKILRNTPNSPDKIESAFNTWFDAFRTLKFVHYFETKFIGSCPPIPLTVAFSELYSQFGLPGGGLPVEPEALLEFMRRHS